jgi:hypothetical protein
MSEWGQRHLYFRCSPIWVQWKKMFFLSCGIFSFSSVSVRTGFRFRRRVHLFAQVSQIRAVFFSSVFGSWLFDLRAAPASICSWLQLRPVLECFQLVSRVVHLDSIFELPRFSLVPVFVSRSRFLFPVTDLLFKVHPGFCARLASILFHALRFRPPVSVPTANSTTSCFFSIGSHCLRANQDLPRPVLFSCCRFLSCSFRFARPCAAATAFGPASAWIAVTRFWFGRCKVRLCE